MQSPACSCLLTAVPCNYRALLCLQAEEVAAAAEEVEKLTGVQGGDGLHIGGGLGWPGAAFCRLERHSQGTPDNLEPGGVHKQLRAGAGGRRCRRAVEDGGDELNFGTKKKKKKSKSASAAEALVRAGALRSWRGGRGRIAVGRAWGAPPGGPPRVHHQDRGLGGRQLGGDEVGNVSGVADQRSHCPVVGIRPHLAAAVPAHTRRAGTCRRRRAPCTCSGGWSAGRVGCSGSRQRM